MALSVGVQAPDFSLASTSGSIFTLSKHAAGKPLVIYFYPKDFTGGCTKEACEFRDSFELFRDLDIDILGISKDTVETHHEFRKAHRLPFHLLADTEGKVAGLYEVYVPLIRFIRRTTYLLDRRHRIVAAYENNVFAEKHIHTMVEKVKSGLIH